MFLKNLSHRSLHIPSEWQRWMSYRPFSYLKSCADAALFSEILAYHAGLASGLVPPPSFPFQLLVGDAEMTKMGVADRVVQTKWLKISL